MLGGNGLLKELNFLRLRTRLIYRFSFFLSEASLRSIEGISPTRLNLEKEDSENHTIKM